MIFRKKSHRVNGFFREGRGYLSALVHFPRWDIYDRIDFLVDTGARFTSLSPVDGFAMGVPYRDVAFPHEFRGSGRTARFGEEQATLVFALSGEQIYVHTIRLYIARPIEGSENQPSWLGADVIDRWAMTYEPRQNLLTFEL